MTTLVLQRSGDDLTIAIPAETCARLDLVAGDMLRLIEDAGSFRLVKIDAEIERQLDAARTVLDEEHAVLRGLASQRGGGRRRR